MFFIASCLYNEDNYQYITNDYIIHPHNIMTWELTCLNKTEHLFTLCDLDGTWRNIQFCHQGNDTFSKRYTHPIF